MTRPASPLTSDQLTGVISNVVTTDAGFRMVLRLDASGHVWLSCQCGEQRRAAGQHAGLRLMVAHRTTCGVPAALRVTAGEVDARGDRMRGELRAVDVKAGILAGLAGAMVPGVLALLVALRPTGWAAVAAWAAVACLALAVLELGAALWPRLPGADQGFRAYATAATPHDVLAAMAAETTLTRAGELHALSGSATTKYQRIQIALASLGLALVAAITAAALALYQG